MHEQETGNCGNFFYAMMGLVLLLIYTGCNNLSALSSLTTRPNEPETVAIDTDVVTANTRFGFDLFNQHSSDSSRIKTFSSRRLSISIALAMTLNGASGETKQAMTNTMQLQGLDAPTQLTSVMQALRQARLKHRIRKWCLR